MLDELTTCEVAQASVITALKNGELTSIDGVMSPLSIALTIRLGSTIFDMNSWWVASPQGYTCPACGREKINLARLNNKQEVMCHLVEHHDHMKDVLKRRFQEISVKRAVVVADEQAEKFAKRSATMISAYENTLICVDCNNADVLAKKASAAHRDFSFSPQELFQIVKSEPNKSHEIDIDIAKTIWAEQQGTFLLRMKIADRIAEIAANNEHWFQPGNLNCDPNIISRRANSFIEQKGAFGVLSLLSGSKRIKQPRLVSEWREKSHHAPSLPPTSNEIEHAGQVGNPKFWNMLNDEWKCPCCLRSKREIVRKNKHGEWIFSATSNSFYNATSKWKKIEIITCGDCLESARNLGKEAASHVIGKTIIGFTAQISIQEVQSCVIPKSYSRHNIDNAKAEQILRNIIHRLL